MNYEQMERLMAVWSRTRYSDGMPKQIELDDDILDETLDILTDLELWNSNMDGNSVMGLRNRTNERDGTVNFSEVFHAMVDGQNFFSPAYFFYKVTERCFEWREEHEISDEKFNEKVTGLICRGARAFPSMIRELNLKYFLEQVVGDGVDIESDPEMDVKNHVDLRVTYNGKAFNLWSYLQSDRGKKFLIEKLRGEHGKYIPQGMHILCPVASVPNRFGWILYPEETVNSIAEFIKNPPAQIDNYKAKIEEAGDDDVNDYVENVRLFIKEE